MDPILAAFSILIYRLPLAEVWDLDGYRNERLCWPTETDQLGRVK